MLLVISMHTHETAHTPQTHDEQMSDYVKQVAGNQSLSHESEFLFSGDWFPC